MHYKITSNLVSRSITLFVYGIALLLSSATARSGTSDDPIKTSLYSVLTNSSFYDGKLIAVSGFICLRPQNPGVFFSYRYCEEPTTQVGIGLNVPADSVKKREEYGHESYGEIIGIYHAALPSRISIDSGLGGASISVERISPNSQPFPWSYNVIRTVGRDEPAYSKIMFITNSLLQAAKSKNYSKLAETFVPSTSESFKLYVSDFQNTNSRLGWVFFGANHSIYSALNDFQKEPSVEIYFLKEPDDYLSCVSFDNSNVSFQPDVNYLLEGGKKFCFLLLEGKFVSNAEFLYN